MKLPKTKDVGEQFFITLLQGHSIVRKFANAIAERLGITVAEYHLLRIVENDTKTTASEIQKRLLATAPSVAQAIDRLERKQLIKRTQDTDDKRILHISLTKDGKKAVRKTKKNIQKAMHDIQLSPSLLTQATEHLESIHSQLSSSPFYHAA